MQSRMFLIAAVLGLAACSSPEEMEQAVALEGGGQSARANSVSAASWEWQVAADTPRFLSLTAKVASFGGGAHGNYGKDVLLWDRQRDVTLAPLDRFASPAALNRAISSRVCAELDRQRAQRRGMVVDKATPFGQCPPVEDLEVILGSADGEAFDRIGLYAAPYVAGAYAEGDYEITLPLDVAIMAAVKPQYRGAFSAR